VRARSALAVRASVPEPRTESRIANIWPLDDRAAGPIRPSTKRNPMPERAAFLPDDQPRKLDGDDLSAIPTAG
jgi:hypothetical protein